MKNPHLANLCIHTPTLEDFLEVVKLDEDRIPLSEELWNYYKKDFVVVTGNDMRFAYSNLGYYSRNNKHVISMDEFRKIRDNIRITTTPLLGVQCATDVKPPLGLTPKSIHKALRIKEIEAAIQRYLEVNKDIPAYWIQELIELKGTI